MMAEPRFQTVTPQAPLPDGIDARLMRLLTYWRSKCRGGRIPGRRDIDPVDIPSLLPAIFLLDVEPADFRFRLVGEEVLARYGGLKGRSLRQLMRGPDLVRTLDEHRRCVVQRQPVFTENSLRSAGSGDVLLYQRLLVPLADADGAVGTLAGVMAFRSDKTELAAEPWARPAPPMLRLVER